MMNKLESAIAVALAVGGVACTAEPPAAERRTVQAGEATIAVEVRGAGETVVMLPSLGRGPKDFHELADRLVASGYRVALPAPRGIEGSTGPMEGLTLHDLAEDVAAVIEALGDAPVTVVGHAYGNRVARTLAADRPDLVDSVVLLAAGGKVTIRPAILEALGQCFQLDLPEQGRLAAIKMAFFAERNDPAVWLDGWWPAASEAQVAATEATELSDWWTAGSAPLLLIQGLEDAIAPPENARLLQQEIGDRVKVVELADAGHALLPERPAAIADAILRWMKTRSQGVEK